jgi:hypothetical protein
MTVVDPNSEISKATVWRIRQRLEAWLLDLNGKPVHMRTRADQDLIEHESKGVALVVRWLKEMEDEQST